MQAVQRVGLEEAMTHLIDLINAAMRGEDVVIVKDERSMVRLVPMCRPSLAGGRAVPKG